MIAGIVTIANAIILAQIVNIAVLVPIKSVKLPSERRKMFAERITNDNLLLLKGFLARLKSIITEMQSNIYENI
jgi:hypothetical protein